MSRGVFKKRLAVIMTAACVLTVIPTPAFAQELADAAAAEATVDEGFASEVSAADEAGELVEADVNAEEVLFDEGDDAVDEAVFTDGADDAAADELFMDISQFAAGDEDADVPADETDDIYAQLWDALGSGNEGASGSVENPVKVEFNTVVSGDVNTEDDLAHTKHNSYYKFTVPKAGRIRLDTVSDKEMGWHVRSADADNWWNLENCDSKVNWTPAFPNYYYTDNTVGGNPYAIDLIPGDYYMVLTTYGDTVKWTANYAFQMTFIELKPMAGETLLVDSKLGGSNNTQKEAIPIELNKQYLAQKTADTKSQKDWYQFTPKKSVKLYLTASTQQVGHVSIKFVDGSGMEQGYYGEPPYVELGRGGIVGYPIVLTSEDYQKKMRPTTLKGNTTISFFN